MPVVCLSSIPQPKELGKVIPVLQHQNIDSLSSKTASTGNGSRFSIWVANMTDSSKLRTVVKILTEPEHHGTSLYGSHSPTEREERNQHDGSSLERVPGKQGEIPRPLGRKRRQRLLSPWLALGY